MTPTPSITPTITPTISVTPTLTPTPTPICLTTGNACSLGGECCSGICLGGGLCQ